MGGLCTNDSSQIPAVLLRAQIAKPPLLTELQNNSSMQ